MWNCQRCHCRPCEQLKELTVSKSPEHWCNFNGWECKRRRDLRRCQQLNCLLHKPGCAQIRTQLDSSIIIKPSWLAADCGAPLKRGNVREAVFEEYKASHFHLLLANLTLFACNRDRNHNFVWKVPALLNRCSSSRFIFLVFFSFSFHLVFFFFNFFKIIWMLIAISVWVSISILV